jgi:hypothetical protein
VEILPNPNGGVNNYTLLEECNFPQQAASYPVKFSDVPKPLPSIANATAGSPCLAYSAEVVTSATKAGSYGVYGEGESHTQL